MLILKYLKKRGKCEEDLPKRKWQSILLKNGFLELKKNAKDEKI